LTYRIESNLTSTKKRVVESEHALRRTYT